MKKLDIEKTTTASSCPPLHKFHYLTRKLRPSKVFEGVKLKPLIKKLNKKEEE
jgi:hypothetical protein